MTASTHLCTRNCPDRLLHLQEEEASRRWTDKAQRKAEDAAAEAEEEAMAQGDYACNICGQKVCACDDMFDAWRDSRE